MTISSPGAPSPQSVLAAVVEIGERRELGPSPLGRRFMIDIAGGSFEGHNRYMFEATQESMVDQDTEEPR